MARYEYAKPNARAALLDELHAAGITDAQLEMDGDKLRGIPATTVWVTTDAAEAAVRAAVDAHDPAAIDAAEADKQTKFDQAVAFLKGYYNTPNASITVDQTKNAVKALTVIARKHNRELALDD